MAAVHALAAKQGQSETSLVREAVRRLLGRTERTPAEASPHSRPNGGPRSLGCWAVPGKKPRGARSGSQWQSAAWRAAELDAAPLRRTCQARAACRGELDDPIGAAAGPSRLRSALQPLGELPG